MPAGGIASPSPSVVSLLATVAPVLGRQAAQRLPSPHHLLGTEPLTGSTSCYFFFAFFAFFFAAIPVLTSLLCYHLPSRPFL